MGFIKFLIELVTKLFGGGSESPSLESGLHAAVDASARRVDVNAGNDNDDDEDDEDSSESSGHEPEGFDLAGFNPAQDEDAFFEAILYIESEGMIAPNFYIKEEDHERVMKKYGVRNSSHWRTVRDSCYQVLYGKYGSDGEVHQREMNFRQGLTNRGMAANKAAKARTGDLAPVEGITLEQWAATNAAIFQGAKTEDLLRGAAIDLQRWLRVSAEWNARMARDTTFTVAQIYGDAFQAASTGKYAAYAKEATAARDANRDVTMAPPITLEEYWRAMHEQGYGAQLGEDPVETLKKLGLTVADWCDLSAFMGYHLQRTWGRNQEAYTKMMKAMELEYKAKHPGIKADLDISF